MRSLDGEGTPFWQLIGIRLVRWGTAGAPSSRTCCSAPFCWAQRASQRPSRPPWSLVPRNPPRKFLRWDHLLSLPRPASPSEPPRNEQAVPAESSLRFFAPLAPVGVRHPNPSLGMRQRVMPRRPTMDCSTLPVVQRARAHTVPPGKGRPSHCSLRIGRCPAHPRPAGRSIRC